MSEQPDDFETVIAKAPAGVIMHGTVTVHKAVGGQVIMVAEIGGQTHKKVIPPVFIRAMSGKGPMGKVLGRFLGNPAALEQDGGGGG